MSVHAVGVEYGQASVWHLTMLCPRCGGDMDLISQGRIYTREHTSIVKCRACGGRQQLMVRLLELVQDPCVSAGPKGGAQCGTDAGYHRHRHAGEHPCDDCRAGHARAALDRDRRKRNVAVA